MRIAKLTALAALTILVAGVVTAAAHTVNYQTKLVFQFADRTSETTGNYGGVIRDGRAACIKNRNVQVFHDSNPDFRIGSDRTDADGVWELTGPAPPDGDMVYAVAKSKAVRVTGVHRHKCAKETTPKEVFPFD